MLVPHNGRQMLRNRNMSDCVLEDPPPGIKIHTELGLGLQTLTKEQILDYNQKIHRRGLELTPDAVKLMPAREAGISADPKMPAAKQARINGDLLSYNVLISHSDDYLVDLSKANIRSKTDDDSSGNAPSR